MTDVPPGNYAIIVDGYTANSGTFKLNVKGTVAPQTPCSSPLFTRRRERGARVPDRHDVPGHPAQVPAVRQPCPSSSRSTNR